MTDMNLGASQLSPADPAATAVGDATFAGITVAALDAAGAEMLDGLTFGVIGMDAAGRTKTYNLCESRLAGLSRDSVLDQEFFLSTGVCMNNFLGAQRFEDEPTLDVTLDYVLTFRMRPTPAKLRLLQQPGGRLHYVLVQR